VAVDFQVVFPIEAIDLSRVRLILGPPRALDIVGKDFRSVDEVFINNVASPDVVVLGPQRLIAQVPEDQLRGDRILNVLVLSKRLTVTARSVLKFRIGKTPGKVTGLQRLVQLFLKVLLTTPGRDIFNKRLGGAGLKNVGGTYGSDQGADIVNDFIIAVDNTSRQIVAIQGRNPSLPREERLLSAKVVRASYVKEESGLDVTVAITSQAGREALANVGL
jgi:hypothetical protein